MTTVAEVTDELGTSQRAPTTLKSQTTDSVISQTTDEVSKHKKNVDSQQFSKTGKMTETNKPKSHSIDKIKENVKTVCKRQRVNKVNEEEEVLLYGASHALKLFVPITLSMALVVATITSVMYYRASKVYSIYTPFHEETNDPGTKLWQSMANASIMLCVIATMTLILLLLYKFQFYKVINGWLIMSSVMLLFFFSYTYLEQVLLAYNVPMDYITAAIIMWNFGIGGLFCIHWKGPLLLQQAYLIVISALVSLMFIKYLPDWTTWSVLCVLVFWDLFAVLCPKGPLKMLVETAQTRNEPIFPALIYSSTVLYNMAVRANSSDQTPAKSKSADPSPGRQSENVNEDNITENNKIQDNITDNSTICDNRTSSMSNQLEPSPKQSTSSAMKTSGNVTEGVKKKFCRGIIKQNLPITKEQRESGSSVDPVYVVKKIAKKRATPKAKKIQFEIADKAESVNTDEERGIKLGLGDFIFYGVLVGKVSSKGDWNTTLACFVAILIGLCCTFFLLAISRKAVPALPISLTFGLVFNFITSSVVQPFMDSLASEQVYI